MDPRTRLGGRGPSPGAVTSRLAFASYPVAAKLTDWGIRLHMGYLFGLPHQHALAATAAALFVMIVHGYRMWGLRRPTRGGCLPCPARATRQWS